MSRHLAARWQAAVNARWYGTAQPGPLLRALSGLYGRVADARAAAHRREAEALPVPVVVVGNLTAGGAGKTPVTLALTALAAEMGLRVAIVSRGYGGRLGRSPHVVDPEVDDAGEVGDEPLMLARASAVPVCIARRRNEGVRLLATRFAPQLVLSDDGLQHYRMPRAAEICVVDGRRGLGNGWRLPAGPLREDAARMAQCDLVVVNGDGAAGDALMARPDTVRARLRVEQARCLRSGARRPLSAFAASPVRAMAGIADPQRFFDTLAAAGLECECFALADHAPAPAALLREGDPRPLLMTEKDAVKLATPPPGAWAVEARLVWDGDGAARAAALLKNVASSTDS